MNCLVSQNDSFLAPRSIFIVEFCLYLYQSLFYNIYNKYLLGGKYEKRTFRYDTKNY